MTTRTLGTTILLTMLPALGLIIPAGCSTVSNEKIEADRQSTAAAAEPKAQLFKNMGPHTRKVTTKSAEAQQYFDQGLTWMYAFNHDEAVRSFTRAAELDPGCAMAWWGVALCHGPNYNDPKMTDERSAAAWDALQKALAQIDDETPAERALIAALAHRYKKPWPEDRAELDQAYADAMANVWAAHMTDSDVGTLYAEAMMDLRPWKLYALDYTPAPGTDTIVTTLERVLQMDPDNPGANHLYIHAVEPSADPDRGIEASHRLDDMVHASGHLLHMPSHIYVKTGRWNEAITQNEKSLRSDAAYRKLSPKQLFQHMYMTHNAHMLAYAAMMSGREREAMAAARAMWNNVPPDVLTQVGPFIDRWFCSVYDVQKRFGRWDALLAEPAPPDYLPITTAVWRAHRAIAYAAKKDFENAKREQTVFREVYASIPEDLMSDNDAARKVLEVSEHFIVGEIALQQEKWDEAAEALEQAVEIEDTLTYGEPPQWLQPTRHTLGAVYLKSGQYANAERVYRADLAKWPNNGWSLYGLSRALHGQGKIDEASEVESQLATAWKYADAPIMTSCVCIPEV